jgi:hypothetical protein
MANQRAFPRSKKRLELHYTWRGVRYTTATADVSVTGMFILASDLPEVGEGLVLEVRTPGGDILRLNARVARLQPGSVEAGVPMGFGVVLTAYNQVYDRLVATISIPPGRSVIKKS